MIQRRDTKFLMLGLPNDRKSTGDGRRHASAGEDRETDMKITKIRIYLIAIGSLHPVLAEIVTDDGLTGIGEAAIAYGHGGTAAAGMIKDLAALVLGRDPSRIEEIWSDMYDHSFWAKGGGAIMFAGISALETALWDIKGKALGVPIYELLGGKFRDAVRVYANGWSFKCVSPDDYARAGAVGPGVDIMLDLSGGLTTDETIRLCRRWQALDILFVEEPADPFDVGALHKIAQQIEIPIAVGERLYTRHGFREIFERRAADIVQPDIGNTGGIMETKKIAAMAEAYNMRVQPHICASPVATAAALQIDACIANFMIQELYPYRSAEHFAIVDDAPEHHVSGGIMTIPTRPGLGINLMAEKVRPYLWAECGL